MPKVRDFPLFIDPQELLDASLAQLRTLTAFLSDHLPRNDERAGSAAVETRLCEEIMRSLDELIAKAHAVRDCNCDRRLRWR